MRNRLADDGFKRSHSRVTIRRMLRDDTASSTAGTVLLFAPRAAKVDSCQPWRDRNVRRRALYFGRSRLCPWDDRPDGKKRAGHRRTQHDGYRISAYSCPERRACPRDAQYKAIREYARRLPSRARRPSATLQLGSTGWPVRARPAVPYPHGQ